MDDLVHLHEPITDAATVEEIVRAETRESQHLELKAMWWPDKDDQPADEEAARDVAAFLNSEGGTLVIGVSEKGDRASGYCPAFDADGKHQQLLDWLHNRLVPQAAVRAVAPEEFASVDDTDLMVVNIQPWPHGPVAVRDGATYRFPYRRDRDTRDMEWEDIVMRNDAARRRTYLRLRALTVGVPEPPVFIASRRVRDATALEAIGGQSWAQEPDAWPIPADPSETHGFVDALAQDHLVLQLTRKNGGHQRLSVPYEFVEAVWIDRGAINLALSARLFFRESSWILLT